jgi:hypothetical protein
VASEVLLGLVGVASLRLSIRIWREAPSAPRQGSTSNDRRPQWLVVSALPISVMIISLAIGFPLSYGLQSKSGFLATTCFVVGGLSFALAALCAVILVLALALLFVERPVPRFLTPPSQRKMG